MSSQQQLVHDKKIVARSLREFGWDVFVRLRQNSGGGTSVVYSPAMLSSALALAHLGAEHETLAQLIKAMHVVGLDELQYRVALTAMLTKMGLAGFTKAGDGVELLPANKIWTENGKGYMKDFEKNVTAYFSVSAELADFAADTHEQLARINTWIDKRSGEKIKWIVPDRGTDEKTKVVLTSALVFRGAWRDLFIPEPPRPFVDFAGKVHDNMPFIRTISSVRHKKCHDYEAIELPYGPQQQVDGEANLNYALVVVLPPANTEAAMTQLVKHLEGPGFNLLVDEMFAKAVDVSLPKFTASQQMDCKEVLEAVGIKRLFDNCEAQLKRLSPEFVHLDHVYHATHFEVDESHVLENGHMVQTSGRAFVVDRPFLYFVWHKAMRVVTVLGQFTGS